MQVEPKKKSKRTRWIVLAVVAVVVVAVAIWFVSERPLAQLRQGGAQAANPESSQIVTAFVGDLSAGATASGWLLPQREAHLALGIAGRVEEVYGEVGDQVQAGDPLIRLEASSLERGPLGGANSGHPGGKPGGTATRSIRRRDNGCRSVRSAGRSGRAASGGLCVPGEGQPD